MNKGLLVLSIGLILAFGTGGFFLLFIQKTPTNLTTSNPTPTVDVPASTSPPSLNSISASQYVDYSPLGFANLSTQRRVLYFHASWCPICKAAHQDFQANSLNLPDNVEVFRVDYDTEKELKAKYGITYQHTFVQVDAQGNELAKWNGGGVNGVIQNLK